MTADQNRSPADQDLVLEKLQALHFALLKMEAMEQLEQMIKRLDAEIMAEHENQFKVTPFAHYWKPVLIMSACS